MDVGACTRSSIIVVVTSGQLFFGCPAAVVVCQSVPPAAIVVLGFSKSLCCLILSVSALILFGVDESMPI